MRRSIATKSAAVVLGAVVLGAIGSGVAFADTPATGAQGPAAVSSAVAGTSTPSTGPMTDLTPVTKAHKADPAAFDHQIGIRNLTSGQFGQLLKVTSYDGGDMTVQPPVGTIIGEGQTVTFGTQWDAFKTNTTGVWLQVLNHDGTPTATPYFIHYTQSVDAVDNLTVGGSYSQGVVVAIDPNTLDLTFAGAA